MKTYTFDELDERAVQSILNNAAYMEDMNREADEKKIPQSQSRHATFIQLGWRFNEHGERIA